jgi:hypothetical protein
MEISFTLDIWKQHHDKPRQICKQSMLIFNGFSINTACQLPSIHSQAVSSFSLNVSTKIEWKLYLRQKKNIKILNRHLKTTSASGEFSKSSLISLSIHFSFSFHPTNESTWMRLHKHTRTLKIERKIDF